jgi:hypothetical protein
MQEALNFVGGLHTGEGKYSLSRLGMNYPNLIYIDKNYLDPAKAESTPFVRIVGSLGISSSIGQFVHQVFEEFYGGHLRGEEQKFIFWLVQEPGLQDSQRTVLVQFRSGPAVVLCGGMTNYSGEGGAALFSCFSFVMMISDLLGIPVEVKEADLKAYRQMLEVYWDISVAEMNDAGT